MSYRLEFTKPATKQFKALSQQVQQRLKPKIEALTTEPRPAGMVKLTGEDELYRIWVGEYRVIAIASMVRTCQSFWSDGYTPVRQPSLR